MMITREQYESEYLNKPRHIVPPERIWLQRTPDGSFDNRIWTKGDVEYVRRDIAEAMQGTYEDVGHPRINNWPCVCSKCLYRRGLLQSNAACPACGHRYTWARIVEGYNGICDNANNTCLCVCSVPEYQK